MLHRLLSALALLIVATAVGACDAGTEGSQAIQVTTPPHLSGLSGSTDTLRVDLAAVFASPSGQRLFFHIEEGPADALLVRDMLMIPPQEPSQIRVVVRASNAVEGAARATITASFGYTDRITVLAPLKPITLSARRDTVIVNLALHVSAPAGAEFALEQALPGLWIEGTRLIVAPDRAVMTTLDVRVSARGYEPAHLTAPLRARSDWCTEMPSGHIDPVPFVPGDMVRFAFREWTNPETGQASRTVAEGTITWTVSRRECEYGGTRLELLEAGVATTGSLPSEFVSVLLPSSGDLPSVGRYITPRGPAALPRYLPVSPTDSIHYQGTIVAGAGEIRRLNVVATDAGIHTYRVDSWGYRGYGAANSLSITRID